MKIALGTVQFGLAYGVANTGGKVDLTEIRKILRYAADSGVDTLDTAIAYGDSEQNLGEAGVDGWQIVSKLPSIPETVVDVAAWAQTSLNGSLRRLRANKLQGLLLHRSQELQGPMGKQLFDTLEGFKAEGLVKKIGVSIYDPQELDLLWPHYKFDLIQAPFNILDRRLATSGWLERLCASGVEVHVRSAFLQGLLLMNSRPEKFRRWDGLWKQWDRWLAKENISALQACLGYVMAQPEISRIVIGVDNLAHLQEILACSSESVVTPPDALSSADVELLNPSHWSSL